MVRIAQKLETSQKHLGARILVQVHDDLLLEVPQDSMKGAVHLVRHEMEQALRLSVPLRVDIKTGKNWADLKTFQ
jgi:DNA polymerase-1